MAVSLVNPPPFEVGEPTQTGGLECFHPPTELFELLLGLRIRELCDRLGAPINDGCKLAHLPLQHPPAPSCISNVCSITYSTRMTRPVEP